MEASISLRLKFNNENRYTVHLRFSRYHRGDYVGSTVLLVRVSGRAYPVIALDVDLQVFALAGSCEKTRQKEVRTFLTSSSNDDS